MTGALFLEELAESLRNAAYRLEQGNVYERLWSAHLRQDRLSIIALALTWREPAAAEVEGGS